MQRSCVEIFVMVTYCHLLYMSVGLSFALRSDCIPKSNIHTVPWMFARTMRSSVRLPVSHMHSKTNYNEQWNCEIKGCLVNLLSHENIESRIACLSFDRYFRCEAYFGGPLCSGSSAEAPGVRTVDIGFRGVLSESTWNFGISPKESTESIAGA